MAGYLLVVVWDRVKSRQGAARCGFTARGMPSKPVSWGQ